MLKEIIKDISNHFSDSLHASIYSEATGNAYLFATNGEVYKVTKAVGGDKEAKRLADQYQIQTAAAKPVESEEQSFIRNYLADTAGDHFDGEELEKYADRILTGPWAAVEEEFRSAFVCNFDSWDEAVECLVDEVSKRQDTALSSANSDLTDAQVDQWVDQEFEKHTTVDSVKGRIASEKRLVKWIEEKGAEYPNEYKAHKKLLEKLTGLLKKMPSAKTTSASAGSEEVGGYAKLIFVAGMKVGMKLDVRSSSGSTTKKPFKEKYKVNTLDDGPFVIIFTIDPSEVDDTDPSVSVEIVDAKGILGKKNAKTLSKSILDLLYD